QGVSAVTVTTAGTRPPPAFGDIPRRLSAKSIGELGQSAQEILGSLNQGLEVAQGTSSYVWVGNRIVQGWAIELVLIAFLIPFLVGAVDLFAYCRRRRIELAPALRALRSRLAFWLFVVLLFELFGLRGAWPDGAARPVSPRSAAATSWPAGMLLLLALLSIAGWLVTRERLLPRGEGSQEEDLAGPPAALL